MLSPSAPPYSNSPPTGWVLISLAAEIFGYTEEAIRNKIKKGVWIKGTHWRKAPDNRVFIHIGEVHRWIESAPV
jgi:hypothetical protein